jgi:hypothetical protein
MRFPSLGFTHIGLLSASLFAGGCTQVADYAGDRARDLLDIVPISFAAGPGLAAEVRVTPLAGVAAGYADVYRLGTDEQRFGFLWHELLVGIPVVSSHRLMEYPPLPDRQSGSDMSEDMRHRVSSYVFVPGMAANGSPLPPPIGHADWAFPHRSPWEWLDVEVGAVAMIGARVCISPLQAIDFLAGLVMLDPAGDDQPRTDTAVSSQPTPQS